MWGAWLSCPIPILPALKPPAPGMERAPAGVPKAVLVKTQLPTTGSSPAVDRDGAVLAKLFLGLVHLADEVNEALPRLWHALLRPVRELELPDSPGLAVLERRERECRVLLSRSVAVTLANHKLHQCHSPPFLTLRHPPSLSHTIFR